MKQCWPAVSPRAGVRGEGGVGGGGGWGRVGVYLQGLHMLYSLASDVKSFCIRVLLSGSFSLVFFTPSPPIPLSLVSVW